MARTKAPRRYHFRFHGHIGRDRAMLITDAQAALIGWQARRAIGRTLAWLLAALGPSPTELTRARLTDWWTRYRLTGKP